MTTPDASNHYDVDGNQDDHTSNPSTEPDIGSMIAARFSRRTLLEGAAATLALLATPSRAARSATATERVGSTLSFAEVPRGIDAQSHVAPQYKSQVVIRWGDPIIRGAPAFDPHKQSSAAQAMQLGHNNDFIGFVPLPAGSKNCDHGLLCVNHEYTNAHLMFPGYADKKDAAERISREHCEIEMAGHGHSVIEVRRVGSSWHVVSGSPLNRRLTARTPIKIAGPAAGHWRLRTRADATGTLSEGTINNCSGGVTPWGTVLVGEENFNYYFLGPSDDADEAGNHKRYGIKDEPEYGWHRLHDRFRLDVEPREPNRFGWVVELNPHDPNSQPVKRTALGRFKHEAATSLITPSGQLVVYLGDDSRNEYLYRYVSRGKFDASMGFGNSALLDDGTLYVARFEANGIMRWLPLVHGTGPLTAENGFASQADVLIETRRAADALKATPMDRPEDVETNPRSGHVFVVLTNNDKRKEIDTANPRLKNAHGHILELLPPTVDGKLDHAGDEFVWIPFILCGNPTDPHDGAKYQATPSSDGWISCPDNITFDPRGRLWIATDGVQDNEAGADGIYACDTSGPARAMTRHFFRGPTGAEIAGPCFTPDGSTLFLSVQHPGQDKESTFAQPSTRWPDFMADMPPRPSVVAITRADGGPLGD